MRSLYLFFILFSYNLLFSQTLEPSYPAAKTMADIDKILKESLEKNFPDLKQKEKLLLSLKAKSEELGYELGILQSGNSLMFLYNQQNRNEEVVDLGNKLKKITDHQNKDPKGVITSIYRLNALSLGLLGLDEASFKDYKTAVQYAETIEDENYKFYQLALCYENITGYYMSKKHNGKNLGDSVSYYLNKSLEAGSKIKDNNKSVRNQLKYDHIIFVDMRLGVFYLENTNVKGNIEKAEKYLLDALVIYEKDESNLLPNNRAMLMNQLSWLYLEKKDFNTSIDYAKRGLELEKKSPDAYARVESFEFLASAYLETGEKEKSKFYMDKYTYLKDSINLDNRKQADTTMQKMVANVDEEHQENYKELIIIIGSLVLVASVIIVILWRRRSRILRRNYEQIIENLKNESISQPTETSSDNEEPDNNKEIGNETNEESELSANKNLISTETEARILKRLLSFERSEKFLKKDFTISTLSAQLNTNSKYLSEIINKNKSQNFSNYLNGLRINYIVHKLYNEPKYREYKISYLAEECGYASPQVFVLAFKKINGVTPSYFIQSLKEDEVLVYN